MRNQPSIQLLLLISSILLSSCNAFHNRRTRLPTRRSDNCNSLQKKGATASRRLRLNSPSSSSLLHAPDATTTTSTTTTKFKNFEEVLTTYQEQPLMVMFTAMNCGPCKLMKKELRQVSDMVGPELKLFAIDTEQYPHVGTRFQVAALPCLLLVQNGEPILRIEGVRKAESIVQQIQQQTTMITTTSTTTTTPPL